MAEIKKVKVQNILESQIPEFLNLDNPLFKEFLNQYYISLEHQTGNIDLINNLNYYKSIDNFNTETFYSNQIPHTLSEDVEPFHSIINVNHTIGFPEKYGLLKIDNEIITYTSKTSTSFEGCIRGFSGIDNIISLEKNYQNLNFNSTDAEFHFSGATVENLNIKFFAEIFKKFKYQFIPGFENRDFFSEINLKSILSNAKDFYISKGTDVSYKILFKILYGEEIEVIKPREYMLRPSDNKYFITKNILVEKVLGDFNPLELIGYTLYQNTDQGLANGTIYNIELRPIEDGKILYEISLDPSSLNLSFISTKKSKLIDKTPIGGNTITVDSTIGFSTTSLLVDGVNSPSPFFVTYEEKNVNQFLNVDGVQVNLIENDIIIENNFAYCIIDSSSTVQFRIINVIESVDYTETFGMRVDDKISLSSFGELLDRNSYFSKWIYNIPTKHRISSILSTSSPNIKRIELFDSVNFLKGDFLRLYDSRENIVSYKDCVVKLVIDDNVIEVETLEDISNVDTVLKTISKLNSQYYQNLDNLIANVQNTYIDDKKEHLYVASSGLPDYKIFANDRKILLNTPTNPDPSSGIGKTTILGTTINHRFYTGEKIWVTNSNNLGIETGSYYVTTIGNYSDSNLISLSYSNNDIFSKKYIQVSYGSTGEFVKLDYQYKTLTHQKLLKKIPLYDEDFISDYNGDRSTNNKPIGILLNGVELYSSTLYDENIYYGKIDDIRVISSGDGYDVINTPDVTIVDEVDGIEYGVGAKANLILSGSVSRIQIVNPGSGYDKNIKISIDGGNGTGALLEPIIIKDRVNSGFRGDGTGVNPTSNSITFVNPHNFEDGELIEYYPNSNVEIEYSDPIVRLVDGVETIIGGQIRKLSENSFYYAGVITDKTIKLYRTKDDAANKVNEINLTTSPSFGFHYFRSVLAKNTLTGVVVKESGENYCNRKIRIPSTIYTDGNNGIDTIDNYIFAKGHNFKDKDLVVYSTSGTEISGLSTESKYYVKILDENRFKLSLAGAGNSVSIENYNDEKYIRFNSIGTGTHTFSYPPIEIKIEASLESSNGKLILPTLEPVVLGNVENIFLENGGEKYGTRDIVNFHRRPLVTIGKIDSQAILKPIIIDGSIIDVQILNYGSGYNKNIDLIVSGDGNFAELYPVVEDGKIISVNIINGGVGYSDVTNISIKERGNGAKFLADVYEWKINQVEKNKYLITGQDEGILVPSKNQQDGLQFIHFYPPKILRSRLDDNIDSSNKEELTSNTSPILGWSYDGFPIYGPYYNIEGTVTRIKSSYKLETETNSNLRPTGNMFPSGFFIQDYKYDSAIGDLDEHNGRFIKNEDFPNGTYAYFFTINIDSGNNSIPVYPYVISDSFKNNYLPDNYDPNHNQDLDFGKLNIIRNTSPYYLNSNNSQYDFIDKVLPKYKQDFIVKSVSSAGIDSISIYNSGENYRIGDVINFGAVEEGSGVYASVSRIKGKSIDSINVGITTVYPVAFSKNKNKIIGVSKFYFDFLNNDVLSINNITDNRFNFIQGIKNIIVEEKTTGLSTSIKNIGETGNITIIYLNDILGFNVEDYIKIDEEVFRILQIIPENISLVVERFSNPGVHTSGLSIVELLPRRFEFFDNTSTLLSNINYTKYFNPDSVVATGSSDRQYENANSQIISIPTKSIYIPNHSYNTGQPLTYNVGLGGTGLYVYKEGYPPFQLNDNQTVYAINYGVNFLGISTIGFSSSIGIGNTNDILYFSPPISGIGIAHSLTTQYTEIIGSVENYSLNITTNGSHGLSTNDEISLNFIPKLQKDIKFKYDSNIRRIITEELEFNSESVFIDKSTIEIDTSGLITGDKIVYYTDGNLSIGGLSDNETYFVIVDEPGKIKFAEYYSDSIEGNNITLTSTGNGVHKIAKINPSIKVIFGNKVLFDMSDPSLVDIELKFYKDKDFNRELETYKYVSNSGEIYIDTSLYNYPRELYYTFSKINQLIYPDVEVKNYNLLEIDTSKYNNKFKISVIDDLNFKINLKGRPEKDLYTKEDLKEIYYSTTSHTAIGPIQDVKLNYSGNGYKKVPRIVGSSSTIGKDAIVKAKSNKIGRISSLERVKDGFDYPTDITLLPKLSTPAIVQVEGISRVSSVGIITGGKNYNIKPTLKVIGNDDIILDPILEGNSITNVNIIKNVSNLTVPLRIVSTRNSNGYSIDDIVVSGDEVTLELLNADNQIYPLISTGYGSTEVEFPFSIGDEIFIERCTITLDDVDNSQNTIIKNNYNSSDYGYRFFTVSGVSTENYTVSYSITGIASNLGNYTPDFGYGYVINRKDMAEFEMNISNDLEYLSNELVLGYNSNNVNTFKAKVMENGWNNEINELRLIDVEGELNIGDRLEGDTSLLVGNVVDVNKFNLKSKLNVTRDKLNDLGDRVGRLNDFQQRISDNDYYQKFSYSIQGKVPYNIWKESIKSIVHPSGFKEFSDLTIVSGNTTSMKVGTASSLDLLVNVDNVQSLYTKNNFAMVTEDDQFEDGSIERILFESGVTLKPYILSKTNKVSLIDDISPQFTGTSNYEIVENKDVTFISTDLYRLGVSTDGLKVGDKIGYSTYHFYPDSTYILEIGSNYIGFSSETPHRLYSTGGLTTSITQNLDFYRRIPGDVIVGISSFKLTNNGYPVFYREFDASNGITTTVNTSNNSFILEQHNLYTGQKIKYIPQTSPYSAIASTTVGSGAILEPVIVGLGKSISKIRVISGGSGYDPINKPTIEIIGPKNPLISASFNPLIENVTGIITSIEITNPGLGYFPISTGEIGIVTTAESEGRKDIIMSVNGGIGSALYENGYNVAISTVITGISSSIAPDYSGYQNMFWGFGEPYIPVKNTSGNGIDAKFSVFIVYNSFSGAPISTSIILRDGGGGYSIGDTISIAGTFMGGSTPENDLSFVVSKVSSTRILSESNEIYTNIPGETISGFGSGATFNISRDSSGDISGVDVVFGGENYEITDSISIAGTQIGGSTPLDNLFLSPRILGTDKLPETLYVERLNDNVFKVAGLSTGNILDINSLGVGNHSFLVENPNANSIITIDNIIQNPVYKTNLSLNLSKDVSYNDTTLYVNSGISSVVINDILKVNEEYMIVKNIGTYGTNSITVERMALGTYKDTHNISESIDVYKGNFNIVKDIIYFSTPPYGPTGLKDLEINSSFSGRVFSRRFDSYNSNDNNILLDDISDQFTGIAATEFILKSNGNDVVGIFTNTNTITANSANVDINNNPIILINNIPQIAGVDYTIDTPGQNTIRFIGGTPLGGKITNIGFTTGFGYLPLVGASATVSVSESGMIDNIYITGFGKGYRSAPLISIASTVGSGASITSTIGVGGTLTNLTITNPGSGYTNTILPEVRIDLPQNYYNLPLEYAPGYSGIGTGAKVSVVVGNETNIISVNLDESGTAYKVGDVLVAPGISTDKNSLVFEEFLITVLETFTDNFSGWYPGQFIQFDDISPFFNGIKKRFTLTVTISGKKQVLSLRAADGLSMTNNIFLYINDILQVPGESYTFTGTRIVFKEAPKEGSKCNILFYKGSDLDVEQVEPILTIKEGDIVQIGENINDPFDIPQFDRIVKDIYATDTLDTFTYDSLGISTNSNKIRPLNWTKQTRDRVINGVLYSKSRSSLTSRVYPNSSVIKDITTTDEKIYVDSAIPLFSDLDENRGVPEGLRNIIVLNDREIESPILNSVVSSGGTISSINILDSGIGYKNVILPTVSISSRFITRKDPIYNWSNNVGFSTTEDLNSIGYGTAYISVGNNGVFSISYDGTNWLRGNSLISDSDMKDIIGYENNYISVGNNGSVYKSTGISTNSEWEEINLINATTDILGSITVENSDYNGNFNKIVYNPEKDILVAVGSSGGLFNATGITTSTLYENIQLSFDFNSIAYNENYFVLVGQIGSILYSEDGSVWNAVTTKATLQNLNDIIWNGDNFIAVGNNSTLITSSDGIIWSLISTSNLSANIKKINYHNGLYTILDENKNLYFSLNLTDWTNRDLNLENSINNFISYGIDDEERYVSVGSSGFISYTTPVFNEATAVAITSEGSLYKVDITNGGFGYSTNIKTPVIVESEFAEQEEIYSIKAKGDYGTITDIEVYSTGNLGFGTTTPAILFTLKSDNFPVALPTMEYSQLEVGDYFTILNSNVTCGHALTGVTTSLGGMSNYPISKVGTTTSFIDGIYRVDGVTDSSLGITTVRCHFVPIPAVGADKIQINLGINTTGFYGNYSFGVIYDYQNRSRQNPLTFIVNKDNGLVGIQSGPKIYRTRGVI